MLGTSEIRQSLRRRAPAWHGDVEPETAQTAEHESTATKSVEPVLTIARFTKDGELQVEPPSTLTPDQVVFLAEIQSLAKRVEKNRFPVRQEVLRLLENAANAGVVLGDLKKGEALLARAAAVHERALVGKNRLSYIVGTLCGIVVLAIFVVLGSAALAHYGVTSMGPPQFVLALFAFAGLGSLTSVLMRLSTLDLREETSRMLLMLSGASKPLVAIAFATIVYITLKYKLVAVTLGTPEGLSPEADEAAYWIAAFLCGFAERLGSDVVVKAEPRTAE
jgi:hypothetical protein